MKEKKEVEKNVNELNNYFKKNKGACIVLAICEKKGTLVHSVYGKKQDVLALITACLHDLLKDKKIDEDDVEMVYKMAINDTDYVSKRLQESIDKLLKGLKHE